MQSIAIRIANELNVKETQVAAAVALLDDGATVPFISRYRKEATGGLDDTQMRNLQERLGYLRELEDRRKSILSSIEEQGKLTPQLSLAIKQAETKTRLEDLYLPYKVKRRTKGQIAIEAGLQPLADLLYSDPSKDPEQTAGQYIDIDRGIADTKSALDGAKYILMERFSEDAELIGNLRHFMVTEAQISSSLITGKDTEAGKAQQAAKFKDYFEHSEPIKTIPSHRALAMFRARREGFVSINVDITTEAIEGHPCETMIARQLTYFAAREKDSERRCDIEAGMAKLLAARVSWSNADNALQVHGGNGYALEYPISRVLCDARILNIFEGAAEIQAHVIARGLLSNLN